MSYILDALRRADAERERGTVPGLHSRTPDPAAPAPSPAATARGPWLALGLAAGLAVAGVAVWVVDGRSPPAPATTSTSPPADGPRTAPQSTRAPAPPRPAPDADGRLPGTGPAGALAGTGASAISTASAGPSLAGASSEVRAAGASATPDRPVRQPAEASRTELPRPAAAPARPAPARADAAPESQRPAAPQADARRRPPPEPASADARARPAQPTPGRAPVRQAGEDGRRSTAAAEPARVPSLDQLPADVRRTLPTLAIGGAVWSEHAPSRMLLVGGQLLHEGEAAAPGIVLERIGTRSAVLRRGDLRWEVAY